MFNVFVTVTMRRGLTSKQLRLGLIAPVVMAYIGLVVYNVLGGAGIDQNKVGFNGWGTWETAVGSCVIFVGLYLYRSSEEPGTEYETTDMQPVVHVS